MSALQYTIVYGRDELLDELKKDSTIDITYLGAPKYRLSLVAQDFKTAEKSLKPILEKIEKSVKKQNGVYIFTREESIKIGEG